MITLLKISGLGKGSVAWLSCAKHGSKIYEKERLWKRNEQYGQLRHWNKRLKSKSLLLDWKDNCMEMRKQAEAIQK